MDSIELMGYEPGALGRIVELHAAYYHQHWGLGLYFEAKVATELAAFLSRFNPASDGAWFARVSGQIVGAVFIDGSDAAGQGARLRWFIIAPEYQGRGLGRRLMHAAISFCKDAGFSKVYLTTFAGLHAARHLYDKFGFLLVEEVDGSHLTGTSALLEQKLLLTLPQASSEPAP